MDGTVDKVEGMTIRVVSPDKRISATLTGGENLVLEFAPGTYSKYDESVLERQLARIAAGIWTGYRRGYQQVMGFSPENRGGEGRDDRDLARRRFSEARARIIAVGESANGTLRMESAGLGRWRFFVKPGTVRKLSERQFCAEVGTATAAALADQRARIVALKDEHFGLALPGKQSASRPRYGR